MTSAETSSITCTIHGGRDSVQVYRSLEIKVDHTGYLSALSNQLSTLQSDVNKTLSDLVDKEKAAVGGANGPGSRGKDSEDEFDGNSDEDDNHTGNKKQKT